MFSVQPDEIRQAAIRIRAVARQTPVLRSRTLNALTGVEAHLKAENFQRGGAFKIRGATNFLYSLPEAERARGVVAYSSGNHAQAVAIAARSLGMKATLVMPTDAPRSKMEATRAQGATIVLYDRHQGSREAIGKQISAETGATLVPPFDHPWIIAGQGTCALELLEEVPGLDALVVCLGGGGLLAGCSVMAKAIDPAIRIFGVEPEAGNDYWLSRRAGYRVEIATPDTIADGLRTTKPGAETFPIIQRLVEDVLLVSDDEILAAMRFLLSRMKILVEPSGAVGVAALLHGKLPAGIRRVGVILSGGNVDLEFLARLVEDPAAA
ncbi:MAG: pyridoxal-phosphate dependent enzyme [Bryobacteraceae bacterium]|jgi:threonine dehydratase